jgi:hypothetical protein
VTKPGATRDDAGGARSALTGRGAWVMICAMDGLWERIVQLARLAGIVAIATTNLALSACTDSEIKPDSKVPDLQAGSDAGTADGAASDASLPDGSAADTQLPKADARLWDVLCE